MGGLAMDAQGVAEITGLLWGPLVVVTSAWRGEANGMIAATAMRAFIIPEHPRVSVLVWKFNYTHKLIEHSRVFALNLLSAAQLDKVRAFGFNSGHERNKLADVAYATKTNKLADVAYVTKTTGSPILPDVFAYLDCKVVESMDGGDVTCYLADVVDAARFRPGEVLSYSIWQSKIPAEWKPHYDAQRAWQVESARALLEGQRPGK